MSADPQYRNFSSKLIPGETKIIGIRIPVLRKIAKKEAVDISSFFEKITDEYFEEIVLQAMAICFADLDERELFRRIYEFLPKINNWAVCDIFAAGLKKAAFYEKHFFYFLKELSSDSREFYVRFSAAAILSHYINDKYIDQTLNTLSLIRHNGYYAKMGTAWAIASCFAKYPEETLAYLKSDLISESIKKLTLKKILESRKAQSKYLSIIKTLKKASYENENRS